MRLRVKVALPNLQFHYFKADIFLLSSFLRTSTIYYLREKGVEDKSSKRQFTFLLKRKKQFQIIISLKTMFLCSAVNLNVLKDFQSIHVRFKLEI